MKTKIFCFSGTGNSLMIAKAIASELRDTEIHRLSVVQEKNQVNNIDRVGLIFPVYYGGIPSLVQRSLSILEDYQDTYLFAVVTHAGHPGLALSQLQDELQSKGLELSSGFSIRMPQNFIMGFDIPEESQVQGILKRASDAIHEIVSIIRKQAIHKSLKDFVPYTSQSTRYENFIARVNESDKRFWCDESCTGCEACLKVCPVRNITMENRRPLWLHLCEQCLACINWCPVQAIQYGEWTADKGRYTNPRITISDMKI